MNSEKGMEKGMNSEKRMECDEYFISIALLASQRSPCAGCKNLHYALSVFQRDYLFGRL